MRHDYWKQVKHIALENLVFLDEMGVLLGLMRTHARAAPGTRAYDFKPFYRGGKVSVIGAVSVSKVLAVMTMDGSWVIIILGSSPYERVDDEMPHNTALYLTESVSVLPSIRSLCFCCSLESRKLRF